MTISPQGRRYPSFTIGDRLRKARSLTGLDVREFAERIQVDRNTITNYELEKTAQPRMKRLVLREWAMATGVDLDWLLYGEHLRGPAGGEELRNDNSRHTRNTRIASSDIAA